MYGAPEQSFYYYSLSSVTIQDPGMIDAASSSQQGVVFSGECNGVDGVDVFVSSAPTLGSLNMAQGDYRDFRGSNKYTFMPLTGVMTDMVRVRGRGRVRCTLRGKVESGDGVWGGFILNIRVYTVFLPSNPNFNPDPIPKPKPPPLDQLPTCLPRCLNEWLLLRPLLRGVRGQQGGHDVLLRAQLGLLLPGI